MIKLTENTLVIEINTFQTAQHYVNLRSAILNTGIASIGNIDDNSLIESLQFLGDMELNANQVERIICNDSAN